MIKRLLVPLDPSPYSEAAIRYATELAQNHGAEVTALMIIDEPGIHGSVRPISPGATKWAEKAEQRFQAEAHQRLGGVLETFNSICDEGNIKRKWIEDVGDPAELIGEISSYYDLLVMGLRTFFHFQTSDEPGKTLKSVLGKLLTPILAVPEIHRPFGSTLDVVIAFDGSPASIRSLKQFATNIMVPNVSILVVNASEEMDDGTALLSRAEDYLNACGFDNVRTEWTPEDIIDHMARHLDSAELIVAGMHAKRGLFRNHVGSLTEHLVTKASVPVFIGQ